MRCALLLALLAGTAHAEPEHGSILGGIGLDAVPAINAALTLDGSYRIGWLAVRAIASRGVAADPGDSSHNGVGAFRRYVGGVEARLCGATTTDLDAEDSGCAYLGVDAGWERQHIAERDPPSYDSHGAVLGARFGAYVVHHRLVGRVAFTFFLHDLHETDDTVWRKGLGMEVGLGVRF